MAEIFSSKSIPFKYKKKTGINGSTDTTVRLLTTFDDELQRTFIYKETNTGIFGLIPGRELLGTIDAGQKNIVPFINNDGNYNADISLRDEFQNNKSLQRQLEKNTRKAAKEYIEEQSTFPGVQTPPVKESQVDALLGTNKSKTEDTENARTDEQGGNLREGSDSPAQERPKYETKTAGFLYYPIDIAQSEQDYITITKFDYKPKILGASGGGLLGNPTGENVDRGANKGTVVLPIQNPAGDSNTVAWGDGRLNALEAGAVNAFIGMLGRGKEEKFDLEKKLKKEVDNLRLQGGDIRNALTYYAAGQAANVNNLVARATGGILNPNLELLFQGPELRTFSLAYKLSAREKSEADSIRKIIRFFKEGMSVKRSGDLFLKSPDTFELIYYRGGSGSKHKALNRFKICALRAFNVDYTPLGSYMTYDDPAGTMVAYTISMTFQEIDPIYRDDYQNLSEDEIGF